MCDYAHIDIDSHIQGSFATKLRNTLDMLGRWIICWKMSFSQNCSLMLYHVFIKHFEIMKN